MNHPDHHPNSSAVAEQSGSARAQLAAAFALPFGPVREQRITEAVLALIAAEIGHRKPAIATVLLDWEPYGGLGVAGFRDRHGDPVTDPDLGLDITHYASDIRAVADTALAALTSSLPDEPGLFHLDLTNHDAPHDERRALHERRENPMTTTPRVGDRVRITGLLPADPRPSTSEPPEPSPTSAPHAPARSLSPGTTGAP